MSEPNSNFPFYSWVPKPLGILIMLLMFVPPTFSGGAYLCNVSEMSSDLALWTEDIQMASFFTSIGMCLFPPFMVRFLQARRVKQTYLWGFFLLILLNGVCALTTSRIILFATCFFIGIVRIMLMLSSTFTIAPYLTGMNTLAMFTMTEEPAPAVQYQLERKRTFLMPVLYFVILTISQLSNILLAWFAYAYQWQDAYFVVIGMLMVAMLLVVVTMVDEERKNYQMMWQEFLRMERRKVPGMLLMGIALCCLTYILVYGKTLDWWDDKGIFWAAIVLLLAGGAFLMNALHEGMRGYLPLGVFRYRNVGMSLVLFVLTILFNSASSFISSFAQLSTPINHVQSASLSGWAALGCLLGLFVSVALIARKAHFRTIFCIAFLLMAAANAYLYFQYQSMGLFENMILPTILNYAGLLILYSVVAAWGMKGLPSRYLATYVFLMIWARNAIAPVVGVSTYSNWLNHRQLYYISRLAQDVDAVHVGRAAFAATPSSQLATASLKGRVAKQATLVAMKNITGDTVILLSATAFLVLLLPYRKGETT